MYSYIVKPNNLNFEQRLPTPWVEFFTSIHVWAIIVAHFCNNWGFYTLLTCLPLYMKEVLKYDISQVSKLRSSCLVLL